LAVHDERLDAADPSYSVTSTGADEQHTRLDQLLLRDLTERGLLGGSV
jgi:hypothetical protein